MKRTIFALLVAALSLLLVGAAATQAASAANTLQDAAVDQALEDALADAVQSNQLQVLGLLLYDVQIDHIDYSADGSTALLWLALADRQTGEVLAVETGLAIARHTRGSQAIAQNWSVTLNSAPDWKTQLTRLPSDLITDDLQMRYLNGETPNAAQPINNSILFRGYKLPWAAGLSKRLSGSLGHIYTYKSCEGSCRYAFDFADGTMFPLLAAKGGTVKLAKWVCANGDTKCTNYLILEDQSTSPVSYQVYYHMAYETLPERLRTTGAAVLQGEFIGNVDDTGASSGHHLHYHVYVTPSGGWSWGTSVDILFDDVPINNGRPRTCAEAKNWPNEGGGQCNDGDRFVSGNQGAYPPVGDITSPPAGWSNTGANLSVTGFTHDDQGVTRVQVLGFFNGLWNNLGDAQLNPDSTFSKSVDICQAKIPQGNFNLAVRIFDREGNQAIGYPGERTVYNQQVCYTPPPPSVCIPSANEVALYDATDFLGSACKKFAVGAYNSTQLGSLGNNAASSIQVGANVRAVLYDFADDLTNAEVLSRVETFTASDASLSDNWVGNDHVSGVRVLLNPLTQVNASDLEPFLTDPSNTAGLPPSAVDSLVLAWEGGEGANLFQSKIFSLPTRTEVLSMDWQYAYHWSIGSLPAGAYEWEVTARAVHAGSPDITNDTSLIFNVTPASLSDNAAQTAPFGMNFDEAGSGDGWTASGLWRLGDVERGNRPLTQAWMFNDGVDYKDSVRRGGDLTSPPITLPPGAEYYLRFQTYSEVEDGNPYWDQRRVQLSVNNGPFYDLYQFMDDKEEGPVWINSPALKLVDRSGQAVSDSQVRVRFHFNTLDEDYNELWGWMIDNLTIDSSSPDLSCADGSNSWQQAVPITMNKSVNAVICPQGDVDYFKFAARAGQVVQVDLDTNPAGLSGIPEQSGSLLDSYIFLLDSSGVNVLMENDDELHTQLKDSRLTYIIQRDGDYYVKVRAWDHPGVGGPQYFYTLKLLPFMGDAHQMFLPLAIR